MNTRPDEDYKRTAVHILSMIIIWVLQDLPCIIVHGVCIQ